MGLIKEERFRGVWGVVLKDGTEGDASWKRVYK